MRVRHHLGFDEAAHLVADLLERVVEAAIAVVRPRQRLAPA